MITVPADKINLDFVLGNKVMVGTVNANREYFEMGVRDMAQAEAEYPGWLARLLTHPVKGLENYGELFDKLTNAKARSKCSAKSRISRVEENKPQKQGTDEHRSTRTAGPLIGVDLCSSVAYSCIRGRKREDVK